MPSIPLGQHQPWRLYRVSKEMPDFQENGDSLEFALRSVAAEHLERPIYLVLPALQISSRAGIESSRGVLGSIRCR